MRRRHNSADWRFLKVPTTAATLASDEMSTALRGLCRGDGALTAQSVREDLVAGIRREALLHRIHERLSSGADSRTREQRLNTRRACMEVMGRRYPTSSRMARTGS